MPDSEVFWGWAGATGQAASVESQHRAGEKLLAVSRSLPFDLAKLLDFGKDSANLCVQLLARGLAAGGVGGIWS